MAGAWVKVFAAALALSLVGFAPAHAEMVLSKVIVDFRDGAKASDDIEVWNDGPDRLYVVADPAVIVAPGSPEQSRRPAVDPAQSGILVSPQRLILEPGQRRQLRISAVLPALDEDRVFRVTVKPVAGPVTANADALKLYVGYDVLVIQRPAAETGGIVGARAASRLILTNQGNTAWEVFAGRQCAPDKTTCIDLPARRLYAGTEMQVELRWDTPVDYKVTDGLQTRPLHF